ncbi:GNAT family N-acetyltransferase [Paracraurococcus ruber]|uniref:GNAT family N-acetyltransferase n=1 Tax=Paracraurococcus ruber TaxID=77675 RepID=A0ABS1CVG9_9PROT|nr:GNAT family N-acetyltransferase [Paracraurococcus ruber]MBK1658325.1 GNAT family N-acetyltransferase [Paracraurococcus ruber]TDG25003.1 N-acetyltransferase [Paracraurococcus ruber]
MPDSAPALTLSLHPSIAEIPRADWDACAGDGNPFVSHAFLTALEESGSAVGRTGWLPQHAALRDAAGELVACCPMYAKSHSQGEYVFDYGWADAYERAGGSYYPKLQVCAPFSPVPGPRLLVRPGSGVGIGALGQGLVQACEQLDLSSVHITFCQEAEWAALAETGWLRRLGTQFHWHNQGYASFDDFLGALSSRKRKAIKRERRDAASSGYVLKTLRGPEITERHWKAFHRFYKSTTDKKWGRSAYLTPRFWPLLGEALGDRVVLMVAERDGEPVAGALNLLGTDALYGRNWGAVVDAPFLHFELCYYRAIDFAIEHGLPRVEAGAQGEHKIQRGYLPSPTYSAHWIRHPGLRRAVDDFLRRERPAMEREMEALAGMSPFKRDGEAE